MEADLVFANDPEPITMNPDQIQVFWPQEPGANPRWLLTIRAVDGELQVLSSSDSEGEAECVWSAVSET